MQVKIQGRVDWKEGVGRWGEGDGDGERGNGEGEGEEWGEESKVGKVHKKEWAGVGETGGGQ